MAFKKCDEKPFPPAVVTEIIVIFVLGGDKSFGIFGGSVMTESPADTWGGLHSSKERIPPTYIVVCSLWVMAQQGWVEEMWIQSCPEFLCWESHPEIRSQKGRMYILVVFFFFFFLPLWHLVNYLSSQSLRIFVSQKFIAHSKHWHVQFFKLRWNSHNIQLTF